MPTELAFVRSGFLRAGTTAPRASLASIRTGTVRDSGVTRASLAIVRTGVLRSDAVTYNASLASVRTGTVRDSGVVRASLSMVRTGLLRDDSIGASLGMIRVSVLRFDGPISPSEDRGDGGQVSREDPVIFARANRGRKIAS